MSARDSTLDLLLLDIIRPAQFAATGWTVPLNKDVGDRAAFMQRYLPAYAEADTVAGKRVALPAFADAMFLYYRKDLLAKYHLPVSQTWSELAAEAKTIQAGEHEPQLQGLSFQGAPIEGTVCTFLLPYWSMGSTLVRDGHLTFDRAAAIRSFDLWTGLMMQGVAPRNVAEIVTDRTREDFEAGKVVFAVEWSYAWNLFQSADSAVKGKVDVAALPAVAGGKHVTCIGGRQCGVSAYSKHQADAIKLVRFLSSPDVSVLLADDLRRQRSSPLYREYGAICTWLAESDDISDLAQLIHEYRLRIGVDRFPETGEDYLRALLEIARQTFGTP